MKVVKSQKVQIIILIFLCVFIISLFVTVEKILPEPSIYYIDAPWWYNLVEKRKILFILSILILLLFANVAFADVVFSDPLYLELSENKIALNDLTLCLRIILGSILVICLIAIIIEIKSKQKK